ncbi:anaerobic sulfatase maturase [Vibrio mimicus]|uniref:anaerobic sulfatase maturase n=1 Tax=Vibrio mimicus TaxID=674 RepID=UPI0012AD0968|nr:anaerobic sulfatase maturase [Vibrio mimicus]
MHITIKPVSFKCNINCEYCYYLEKETFFHHKDKTCITYDTLEQLIKSYINQEKDDIYFTWQGGEPTLSGIEFFEKVIELQQAFSRGKRIHNAIQTNGTLLTGKWGEFLKNNKFLVGISIDGPEKYHDRYRKHCSGKGTFKRVMKGIEILNKYSIPFNTLTVVNHINVEHPLEVYEFLKTTGTQHFQFIELLETQTVADNSTYTWLSDSNHLNEICHFSSPPQRFGYFLNEIFHSWIRNDVGHYYIRQFESLFSCLIGNGHSSCVFQPSCGNNLVIESNGDLYECDHFVYPEFQLGNIVNGLNDVYGHKVDKLKQNLSNECQQCQYLELCNGGCPKHRINMIDNVGKSYFCESYKLFFKESIPYFKTMIYLLNNGYPVWTIMGIVDDIKNALKEEM